MHRIIEVPTSIDVALGKDDDGNLVTKRVTFTEFVIDTLLQDVRFGVDRAAAKKAREIETAVDTMTGFVRLIDTTWELLRDVADKPQFADGKGNRFGYRSAVIRQLLPFVDAIINARTDDSKAA